MFGKDGIPLKSLRAGRALRALLVVDSLEVGGAERHVVDLALRRKGHGVTVACSVSGELSGLFDGADVPVRALVGRLVKRRVSVAYARGLGGLVGGGGFDVVHAHIYASAAAAAVSTPRGTGRIGGRGGPAAASTGGRSA